MTRFLKCTQWHQIHYIDVTVVNWNFDNFDVGNVECR